MMRASFLRRFPLLLLAAALVALATFSLHDAQPASADHRRDTSETLWGVTLTADDLGSGAFGCSIASTHCAAQVTRTDGLTLPANQFRFDGFINVVHAVSVSGGTLTLTLSASLIDPAFIAFQDHSALIVDGTEFQLKDATRGAMFVADDTVTWTGTGLSWAAGDAIALVLKTVPTPPSGVVGAETVWAATLTVKDNTSTAQGDLGLGCFVLSANHCDATISGPRPPVGPPSAGSLGGSRVQLSLVGLKSGVLTFSSAADLPDRIKQHATLHVDGVAFSFADASYPATTAATWANSGLSWTVDQEVELRLTTSEPPTLAISSETGTGTFTVALAADPGTGGATVHLVRAGFPLNPGYGAAGHVWDRGGATLSASMLTFTGGSGGNWATPQTVTVTGVADGDTLPDQLVILILSSVSPANYWFYNYVGPGNGDWDLAPGGGWAYNSGSGAYDRVQGSTYVPVGATSNSVTGIYVTVADGVRSGVPTNLRAVAGQTAESRYWKLHFAWDAPTGGATVTGYDLQYRKRNPDRARPPAWTPVTVSSGTSAETNNLDKGSNHPEGTTYEYRVRAQTAQGPGEWSPIAVAALHPADNLVTNLTASPGNGQLTLNWTAPRWPASGYLVHYKLASANVDAFEFSASDPATGWVDANHSGTAATHVIPNLTNGTAYTVRVRLASPHHDHPAASATATPSSGGSGTEGELGVIGQDGQTPPGDEPAQEEEEATAPEKDYSELIAQVREWRNDPRWVRYKSHTDRWDRVLLTFGETVVDTTLTPMSASEAQTYADRGWTRWVGVAEALREIEGG